MPRLEPDTPEAHRIDAALAEWHQGDLALEEHWFSHAADPGLALTPESAQANEGLQIITSAVEGLVVVTQTCDVVRSCISRPFIEVSPLVEVESACLHEVERCRQLAYAFIPAVADRNLVAHLDRVMTVEKSVVANWERTPGFSSDHQIRVFAQALARKRAHFAFPDDFSMLTGRLQRRLLEKHDKQSNEGRALRALREIRVRAAPSWASDQVTLMFWFVRDRESSNFEGKSWGDILEAWLRLASASGRFERVEGLVVTLDDITARDYIESDPLDLDHLSASER